MSARKWATVRRYRDGLVDPSWRAVVNDRGIEWVTDRYAMVRTDMFSIPVTARGNFSDALRPFVTRRILDGRPVLGRAIYGGQAERLGVVGDEEVSALLVSAGNGGATASLFHSDIAPLLDACDVLRLKDGRLYGYQRRPGRPAPVLVAVIQPIRWSTHYLKKVTA